MKRNLLIVCVLTTVMVMAGCGGEKKPQTDRDVLMVIFKAANGPNWSDKAKENWGSEQPLSKWNGVKADENERVTELSITNDSVRGLIPEEIGMLTELKSLRIRIANKTEYQPFPASIGELANLEVLSLTGGIKEDYMFSYPPLGKLDKLKTLYLSGQAKAPEGLGQLSNLKDLEFSGLQGDLPAEMTKLTQLERLFIRGSSFTGRVPADIGNLKNLTLLVLDKTQFIGKIEPLAGELPESIWDLTNIKTMFLRSICNGGTLSPKITNLINATQIEIVECGLTGEIPKELYTMTKLRSFEAYNNNITGTISPEIGNMAALETFWVNNNQLTGTLPATMGKLTKLKSLKVENNQLTGVIPAELANCPLDGVFVKFSGNNFSKEIAVALKAHPRFEKWDFGK
jgi:Leucine-rich repeat (LRR) protein